MIPEQLRDQPLIRVCRPGCRVHDDCGNPGKRPVVGPTERESLPAIRRWLREGGNVGVSPSPDDDLLILDVDDERVVPMVGEEIGAETFTVQTGSGLFHLYLRCPEWNQGNDSVEDDSKEDPELLSVRAENYHVVAPPSTHPETGEEYTVFVDTEIAEVSASAVAQLVERVDDELTPDGEGQDESTDQEGSGRERGPVGGGGLDELDRLIDHDDYRADVRAALEDPDAGHNQRQFAAGFLLDAVGLSVAETVRVIDKFNRWSNYDREITERQVRAVDRSSRGGGS